MSYQADPVNEALATAIMDRDLTLVARRLNEFNDLNASGEVENHDNKLLLGQWLQDLMDEKSREGREAMLEVLALPFNFNTLSLQDLTMSAVWFDDTRLVTRLINIRGEIASRDKTDLIGHAVNRRCNHTLLTLFDLGIEPSESDRDSLLDRAIAMNSKRTMVCLLPYFSDKEISIKEIEQSITPDAIAAIRQYQVGRAPKTLRRFMSL